MEMYSYTIKYMLGNQPLLYFSGGGREVQWFLVNSQCWGVLVIWIKEGQGPTVLAGCAGRGLFEHFFSHLSFLSPFFFSQLSFLPSFSFSMA